MKKISLILILLFLFSNMAFANSGPPIIDPIDQRVIFDEDSGIRLVEEWVTISFLDNPNEIRYSYGLVKVKYKLENLDDRDKKLDILFISPRIDFSSITIMKNNEEIKGISLDKELVVPKNWNSNLPKTIFEPVSNEELYKTPNDIYNPNKGLSGIKFTVEFAPKEVIDLDISYKSPSGYYRYERLASKVHSQVYYLTPAKFWEGESKVNLKVEFPADSKTKLHSNIPLEKVNSYTYVSSLEKIPDEEWVFTFVDVGKLIFGTNNRWIHNFLVASFSLIGILLGFALKKKVSFPWRVLIWLISIAFLLYYFRFTYGMLFLGYFFGPFILILLIIIFAIVKFRKIKNV